MHSPNPDALEQWLHSRWDEYSEQKSICTWNDNAQNEMIISNPNKLEWVGKSLTTIQLLIDE